MFGKKPVYTVTDAKTPKQAKRLAKQMSSRNARAVRQNLAAMERDIREGRIPRSRL